MITKLKLYILFVALSTHGLQIESRIDDTTRRKMVNFLVDQHQFAKTIDPWSSYKDVIHARTIFDRKTSKSTYRVYLFGENSDHGQTYVALYSDKAIGFLLTKDLGKDMERITHFVTESTATLSGSQWSNLLNSIAQCYVDNEATFRPQLKQ